MAALADPKALQEIALFRGLTEGQLSWINDRLYCKVYPSGTNIIAVEQPGEVVYIILSGTVKIHVEQADGTDVILAFLGPGDTVGEMSLVDSTGRSASAVTQEKSTLLWMDRRTFEGCVETTPGFAGNLMRILSRRLRQANEQIQSLATLSIPERVARQILTFAQQYGRVTSSGDILIPLRLTQSDIADLIGASRVRVNRAIVYYKRHGLISVDDDYRITVHDLQALARRCESCVTPRPTVTRPVNDGVANVTAFMSRV